jgi:hypothetical protein
MRADRWADDVAVPTFGPRMVCTHCVPGAAIDQRGLGPQQMRTERAGIETDAANPVADEACILPGWSAPAMPARSSKQKLTGLSGCGTDVIVATAWRVCSVTSNRTGKPVFLVLEHARPQRSSISGSDWRRALAGLQDRTLRIDL